MFTVDEFITFATNRIANFTPVMYIDEPREKEMLTSEGRE